MPINPATLAPAKFSCRVCGATDDSGTLSSYSYQREDWNEAANKPSHWSFPTLCWRCYRLIWHLVATLPQWAKRRGVKKPMPRRSYADPR